MNLTLLCIDVLRFNHAFAGPMRPFWRGLLKLLSRGNAK